MLFEPGMIGRTLDGKIERKLHAVFQRCRAQPPEIINVAERWIDRGVSAVTVADRVRTADVFRIGAETVVFTLAVGMSDWMDRRQINNVEAHIPENGQSGNDVGKGAVALRIVSRRTGKQFIPGGEVCLRSFDLQREDRCATGRETRLGDF